MTQPLPPLFFNDRRTDRSIGFDEFRSYREETNGHSTIVEPLVSKAAFASKSSTLDINGLVLRTQSKFPVKAERLRNKISNLWIVKQGAIEVYDDTSKSHHRYRAGDSAFVSSSRYHTYFTTTYTKSH